MRLPLLLSVPHAGLEVPPEVADISLLSPSDIAADGDGGAAEIYLLEEEVTAFITTGIARAFVDMNRAGTDIRKDGVVKTHTCWDVPIYREPLSEDMVQKLLEGYHRPYHTRLEEMTGTGVRLGIDCHTMAAEGPPVGPDAGRPRPLLCLCDAGGTLPGEWLRSLADCLESAFDTRPAVNDPFQGGYIIRAHSAELPWVQLEISRADFMSPAEKRKRILDSFRRFCEMLSGMRA